MKFIENKSLEVINSLDGFTAFYSPGHGADDARRFDMGFLNGAPGQIVHNPETNGDSLSLAGEGLGTRLRYLRVSRGLPQSAFAKRIGVSTPTISGWESGRSRPRSKRLSAIAEVLGISVSELLIERSAPEQLDDLIDRSRKKIARAIGTRPEKVRITVEF